MVVALQHLNKDRVRRSAWWGCLSPTMARLHGCTPLACRLLSLLWVCHSNTSISGVHPATSSSARLSQSSQAVELGLDAAKRASLRARLQAARDSCPLFDTACWVRCWGRARGDAAGWVLRCPGFCTLLTRSSAPAAAMPQLPLAMRSAPAGRHCHTRLPPTTAPALPASPAGAQL